MTFIKKQINPNSTFEGKEDEDEDEFPLKLHPPNFFFIFLATKLEVRKILN